MASLQQRTTSQPPASAPSHGLRWWLILTTLAAFFLALLALVFGYLINLDTLIEMNPNGDPLVRQDAVQFRIFAWAGIAVIILLLAGAVIGWWRAFRARRNRLAIVLSLLVAVPVCLLVGATVIATIGQL